MSKKIKLIPTNIKTAKGESVTLLLPENGFIRTGDVADTGYYHPRLSKDITNILASDSVFFDVRSYAGYFAKIATNCGVKESNIHCFESDKIHFKLLQKNIDAVLVNDKVNEDNLSLDSYCSRNDVSPDVMKMDIERDELSALKNFSRTIESNKPTVYVEVHPEEVNEERVISFLQERYSDVHLLKHNGLTEYEWVNDKEVLSDRNYQVRASEGLK